MSELKNDVLSALKSCQAKGQLALLFGTFLSTRNDAVKE